jgi:hypothetical protein
LEFLKKSTMKSTGSVTFKEALFSPEYRRATWTLLTLNFFN